MKQHTIGISRPVRSGETETTRGIIQDEVKTRDITKGAEAHSELEARWSGQSVARCAG